MFLSSKIVLRALCGVHLQDVLQHKSTFVFESTQCSISKIEKEHSAGVLSFKDTKRALLCLCTVLKVLFFYLWDVHHTVLEFYLSKIETELCVSTFKDTQTEHCIYILEMYSTQCSITISKMCSEHCVLYIFEMYSRAMSGVHLKDVNRALCLYTSKILK